LAAPSGSMAARAHAAPPAMSGRSHALASAQSRAHPRALRRCGARRVVLRQLPARPARVHASTG
jgi:hypothetical protein